MEDIDVRLVIKKFLRKWPWFAVYLLGAFIIAFIYIESSDKEYVVQSTIQLKDQSLGDKGTAQEKFLSGFELLESDSELEDEIGVLTSYSTIRQSLEGSGFEVSYYQYPELIFGAGKLFAKELYPAPFELSMNTAGWQLMYTPIHLTFLNKNKYRLQISSQEPTNDDPLYVYNIDLSKSVVRKNAVELDTVLAIGQTFQTPYLHFKLDNPEPEILNNGLSYCFTISSLNDIAERYQQKLATAQISDKSNIVSLSVRSGAPNRDIAFLSALNSVYIQNELQKKNQLGLKTIGFIDNQLQEVSAELKKVETKLKSFRAQSNIIDVEVTSQNLTNQLFELEEKQAQLKIQNKFYRDMADYLVRHDNVGDIVAPSSVGIQDASLNNLLIQLSELNAKKIAIDYSSNTSNPVLNVIEKKIKTTKKAILENINNLVSSNKIALQETSRRVNEIKNTINHLPENERNLVNINRGFKFNDNIYNYLLQKRAEAGIALVSNIPDKSVVDAPRQLGSSPVSPNKMFVFMVAFLIGLILPAGIILTKDFFQQKLENEEQLKYWTDIPVLERVVQIKEKEENYVTKSYLANTFRYIRRHIEILQLSQEVKAVGITSATSGEGKTFCALHLAQSFAKAGSKTLIIDADLHQPNLDRYFKVKTKPGLSDYLMNGDEQIIQRTEFDNLDIVTSGTPSSDPSGLLNQSQLDKLLQSWRLQYDIIIFDTPPIGLIADYFAFSNNIDYTLVVVRHKFSEKEHLLRLTKVLKDNLLPAGMVYNGGAQKINNYQGYYQKEYGIKGEKV